MPRWGLVALATLVLLCGVAVGVSFVHRLDQRDVTAAIAEAIVTNCEADGAYRLQQRERALAERASITSQIATNEALIEVAQNFRADPALRLLANQLDRENRVLVRAVARVELFPLPQCGQLENAVRGALED